MTHDERVWHHEMETLEGIHEHAERIASLEELVLDMWAQLLNAYDEKELYEFAERMAELKMEGGQ